MPSNYFPLRVKLVRPHNCQKIQNANDLSGEDKCSCADPWRCRCSGQRLLGIIKGHQRAQKRGPWDPQGSSEGSMGALRGQGAVEEGTERSREDV